MKPYLYYRSGVAYARVYVPLRLKHRFGGRYLVQRLGFVPKNVARLKAELFAYSVEQGVVMSDVKLGGLIVKAGGVTLDTSRSADLQDLKDLGIHDAFMGAVNSRLKRETERKNYEAVMRAHEPYAPEHAYRLEEVVEIYLGEKSSGVEADQLQRLKFILTTFLPSLVDMTTLTHKLNLQHIKEAVLKRVGMMPSNIDKAPDFRRYVVGDRPLGLDLLWLALDAGDHHGYKTIAAGTKDRYMDTLKAFWRWAEGSKIYNMPPSPFALVKKFKNRKAVAAGEVLRKRPFTLDELQRIFAGSVITSLPEECRFWVMMIGLFCGCRVNEIASLQLEDLLEVEGLMCIKVSDDLDRQSVKNDASRRMFPVPQILLDYGFASYVERMKGTGQPYLFPLFFSENYKFGKEASRQFNRLIRTKRVSVLDPEVTFHSLRHTLINALRDSGADAKTIGDISGHTTEATDDVLHRTYLKPDRAVKLKEALDRVAYEGLTILNPYKDAQGVVKRWHAKERAWLKENKERLEV